MPSFRHTGTGLMVVLAQAAAASCACSNSLERDVVVVGGGAAGSHAAVWLRDNGYSVAVVEKRSQLGGHTNFYDDPKTGRAINVGVQAWMQYEDSFAFPNRMGVSTSNSMNIAMNAYSYVDFTSGNVVSDYVAPSNVTDALETFLEIMEEYRTELLPSYENFSAADAIPENLIMPYADFAVKNGIEAAMPQTWYATTMGIGNTMSVPAMWAIQATTIPMIEALLGTALAAVPSTGRLFDLYEAVADFLGSDVLYNTTITSTTRNDTGVSLVATSDSGTSTCINAKRLLLAIQPTPENLAAFDMDATESAVFNQFNFSTVFAGIIRHPSLVANVSYENTSPDPEALNYTVFPVNPQVGSIAFIPDTEDLFQVTAVGTNDDTIETMEARVSEAVSNMMATGVIAQSDEPVDFAIFENHGMMHPRFSGESLRSGVIQQQMALQGLRSTWYTGAAWSAPFSTVLWVYNNATLPSVVAGI